MFVRQQCGRTASFHSTQSFAGSLGQPRDWNVVVLQFGMKEPEEFVRLWGIFGGHAQQPSDGLCVYVGACPFSNQYESIFGLVQCHDLTKSEHWHNNTEVRKPVAPQRL